MKRTKRIWVGRVLSGLAIAFLVFDGVMKLFLPQAVLDAMAALGWPAELARPVGLLELVLLAVHLWTRTAVLGAVLLTGYLGGAVASHARILDPLASHVLFPTYVAILLWVGLYLRDARVRVAISRGDEVPVRGGGGSAASRGAA